MNGFYILIIFGLTVCMSNPEEPGSTGPFNWLIGSWKIPGDGSVYYENWERKNDSLYTGEGLVLAGTDTVFYESIELKISETAIFYIVRSGERNGEAPVAFRLTIRENNTYIFENPEHDFPQRIVYSYPSNDSLLAYIDGTVGGKYMRSDFPMIRRK